MRRIGIIGAGHVGSHVGSALIAADGCDELIYIDIEPGKAQAQADDLQDMVSLTGGPAGGAGGIGAGDG